MVTLDRKLNDFLKLPDDIKYKEIFARNLFFVYNALRFAQFDVVKFAIEKIRDACLDYNRQCRTIFNNESFPAETGKGS